MKIIVKFLIYSIFLFCADCIAQNNWLSVYYKVEKDMLLKNKLNIKDIKFLQKDGSIRYYYLQDIAYYILPQNKKLAKSLLIECSEYGLLDTTKLNATNLPLKTKQQIKNSFFDKINPYYLSILTETTERLALEQHYRRKWMQSRAKDTLAMKEIKKLDSLNFEFINSVIEAKKVPNRGEFSINFVPMFLHVTSEKFAEDSIGFENYRKIILDMVKAGNFEPGLYATWVDRYYVWHLESKKQVFGMFRDVNLRFHEIPDVIDTEKANELRKEIGIRTIEEEIEYRKLKQP